METFVPKNLSMGRTASCSGLCVLSRVRLSSLDETIWKRTRLG